jgi:hypothetical protein
MTNNQLELSGSIVNPLTFVVRDVNNGLFGLPFTCIS